MATRFSIHRKSSIRRIALLSIAAIWIVSSPLLSGCGGGDVNGQFQVDDLRLTLLPSGAKIISGSVHNASHTDVPGVLVQISLFDDDNNLLTSVTIGVEDVTAGSDARFRQPIDSDLDVDRARVKKIVVL